MLVMQVMMVTLVMQVMMEMLVILVMQVMQLSNPLKQTMQPMDTGNLTDDADNSIIMPVIPR